MHGRRVALSETGCLEPTSTAPPQNRRCLLGFALGGAGCKPSFTHSWIQLFPFGLVGNTYGKKKGEEPHIPATCTPQLHSSGGRLVKGGSPGRENRPDRVQEGEESGVQRHPIWFTAAQDVAPVSFQYPLTPTFHTDAEAPRQHGLGHSCPHSTPTSHLPS